MAYIDIKSYESSRYDLVSLGEVMLRLDPGEGRIRNARQFSVWEGGGEYNVARGLKKCFGMRTAIVSAFAENEIGKLLEDFIYQGGVDCSFVQWVPFDGIGKEVRNGLNFVERGYGIRGALGVSDRGLSAASQMKRGQVDWEAIFGREGARWFHTGGIFAALSASTPEVILEAMRVAKKHGTVISYDLNYRPSLWKANGGKEKAVEVNRRLAEYVDVMLGNEEDFSAALGFEIKNIDENFSCEDVRKFKDMIEQVTTAYPNFKVVATTLRTVKTATVNDWGAVCWSNGCFYESILRKDLEILDRVGGGDSFASGLIYGLMSFEDVQKAVEYGAAHGALAMTTPGDTSMASREEIERLVEGGSARVIR